MSDESRWQATVTGAGMEPFTVEAGSREKLERQLGDLHDMHIGRVHWTIEEVAFGGPSVADDGLQLQDIE